MNIRLHNLLAVLLLGLSVPAGADFVLVSKAYEVALSELRLPGTTNGTVTFRECRQCEYHTVRVTAATQYEANDQRLSLEEFRKQVEDVRQPSEVTATVLHHLESDTIKAIRVWF
ncbi:MAG TPA: hypothetical protein VKZ85_07785 [Woeseiaceae bacterium]|nr:hypothetical protein [Woeseiaceae bacterium]